MRRRDSLGTLTVVVVDGGHVGQNLGSVYSRPIEGGVWEDVDVVPADLNSELLMHHSASLDNRYRWALVLTFWVKK
jgi:hypothetical protein